MNGQTAGGGRRANSLRPWTFVVLGGYRIEMYINDMKHAVIVALSRHKLSRTLFHEIFYFTMGVFYSHSRVPRTKLYTVTPRDACFETRTREGFILYRRVSVIKKVLPGDGVRISTGRPM